MFGSWVGAEAARVCVYRSVTGDSDRRFCDDIRRAARSGPDLVAEGYYRFNPREFHRFLNDAKASLGEVQKSVDCMRRTSVSSMNEEFREMSSLANRAIGAANALQKYSEKLSVEVRAACCDRSSKRANPNPEP